MHTASFKHAHALLAGLSAALLVVFAPLAASATTAFADAAEGPSTATQTTSQTATTAPPVSGSTSGGAAPAPTASGKLTLATWFGPGFYGHATACGQKLTPKLVGVASRTLPCGTLVQIGYRGRLLTVPVLDRGPYGHNGAMWDLTSGAARALKIKETVHIATQIVGSVPNTPALGEPALSGTPSPGEPSTALATPPSAAAATTGGAAA